jgi:uncharacterized protein DUF6077
VTSPAGTRAPGSAVLGRPADRAVGFDLTSALDGAAHGAVLAFAAWTLVYDVGLAAHFDTSLLPALCALSLAGILVAVAHFPSARHGGPVGERTVEDTGSPPAPRSGLGVAGLVLGIGAGVAVGLHQSGVPWVWTWALGAMSVAATLVWLFGGGQGQAPASTQRLVTPGWSLPAVAAAIFSLYLARPNGDDAYYVSRSVWTAHHGQISVKDILFTNQAIRPIAGEPPISSIEVLIRALAGLLGVTAGSFTYFLAQPVFTFFAVLAMWMLVRRRAPGRYGAVFMATMVYMAWSGASLVSFGSPHLVPMWRGKAASVSLAVPLPDKAGFIRAAPTPYLPLPAKQQVMAS